MTTEPGGRKCKGVGRRGGGDCDSKMKRWRIKERREQGGGDVTAGSGKQSVSQRQGDLAHPPHPLLTPPLMASPSLTAAAASAPTTTGKETHTLSAPFCMGQWTVRGARPILQEPLPAHYTKLIPRTWMSCCCCCCCCQFLSQSLLSGFCVFLSKKQSQLLGAASA